MNARRFADVTVSICGLIALAPLLAAIAVLIRIRLGTKPVFTP